MIGLWICEITKLANRVGQMTNQTRPSALIFLILAACSRPNPQPELLDPIYSDLQQRSAVAKAAAESMKEEIKKAKDELEKLPARDPSKRKAQQDISRKELQFVVAEQDGLYFEVRAQQRKDFAREAYLKAFNAGKPWPDPKDFEAYKLQRKLAESPREWNSRVPKTERYNKKSDADLRKELDEKLKAAPAGGGGR